MAKKAPGFFKKILTETQLQKKYVKHLEQLDDKTFLRSCYTADGESFHIREDLDDTEIKRLKELAKAIKGNRKLAVKIVPLVLAGALIAGAVFFFTVLANPLLQRGLETGLEAIFDARVNANRFRVSLLRFEVAMDSLTIADRDRPMRNLIQFSTMQIRFNPQAALRGRVYIEEIRADNIRFGTERTVSGALPARPPADREPREPMQIPPLIDIQNFDAMALLNQEFERLQTPRLYNAAIAAYEASLARWQAEQRAARERIAELQSGAEPLLAINVNDFRVVDIATAEQTLNQIRTTIDQVNALVSTVQAAQDDVNRLVSGVQDDINTARALEQEARESFLADFYHLRSFVDLGSGAAMGVLEPVIMGLLTDTMESYLMYGQRALEVLERVRAMQERLPQSSRPPRAERFRGRDVRFPSQRYARFFMGVLATDVLTPSGWHWGFDLRGVSSDPDRTGVPTTLALSLAETGDGTARSAAFNGRADFRSNADERFNAEFLGDGFPVNITAGLSQIGVGGFSGGASFRLNAAGRTCGSFIGGGNISLVEASLRNPSNTFALAADEAIRYVDSVEFGINYEHEASGQNRFSLTTNFDDIFMDAARRIVSQYLRQAEEALERALRERIEQFIDGRFIGREEMDLLFNAVRGDQSAVNELRNILDGKRNELETRLRDAAEDAARQAIDAAMQHVQQIADEVRDQAQQAVQDALEGVLPQAPALPSMPIPALPAPSLPSLPGFGR